MNKTTNHAAKQMLGSVPSCDYGGPIDIWTDGSCRPNPGAGGWAAILRNAEGQTRNVSGGEATATNNRMELRAAISGLGALRRV